MRWLPQKRAGFAGLTAIFLALSMGCGATIHESKQERFVGPAHLIAGVPFYVQTGRRCGPAALATVLGYYGNAVPVEDIADAVFRQDIGGTLFLEMVAYAREKGFSASWYSGDEDDVRAAVNRHSPLIVMVDFGMFNIRKAHYMVIVGYDSEGIYANSDGEETTHFAWRRFLRVWKRTDCWTLRVEPKKDAASSLLE
jgi:ABC-type bacteriocin/lantibiotic exporter with double-glycine peptidase domain